MDKADMAHVEATSAWKRRRMCFRDLDEGELEDLRDESVARLRFVWDRIERTYGQQGGSGQDEGDDEEIDLSTLDDEEAATSRWRHFRPTTHRPETEKQTKPVFHLDTESSSFSSSEQSEEEEEEEEEEEDSELHFEYFAQARQRFANQTCFPPIQASPSPSTSSSPFTSTDDHVSDTETCSPKPCSTPSRPLVNSSAVFATLHRTTPKFSPAPCNRTSNVYSGSIPKLHLLTPSSRAEQEKEMDVAWRASSESETDWDEPLATPKKVEHGVMATPTKPSSSSARSTNTIASTTQRLPMRNLVLSNDSPTSSPTKRKRRLSEEEHVLARW